MTWSNPIIKIRNFIALKLSGKQANTIWLCWKFAEKFKACFVEKNINFYMKITKPSTNHPVLIIKNTRIINSLQVDK